MIHSESAPIHVHVSFKFSSIFRTATETFIMPHADRTSLIA